MKKKYYWIGGVALPEDFDNMVKIGNNQVAANVTQLNYILGIEENINETIKIINVHFEPSFPKYKKLIIKRRVWIRNGVENVDVGFLNVPLIKRIIKINKLRKEVKKIQIEDDTEYVFFTYALTTPIVSIIPYIKKKFGNKSYICQVVPDLPEFMEFGHQPLIKRILKTIDGYLINYCIKKVDLFVLFAEKMKEKLKCKNYVVIEGLINNINNLSPKIKEAKEKNNIVMYAGSLNEEYGIKNLVDAFADERLKEYELHLFGIGDYQEEIIKKCKEQKNIIYHGLTQHKDVIKFEKKALLLVNPRPIDKEYVKYSFPSKILEYMQSGTPLLTTKLPSIPKEYEGKLLYMDGDSSEKIKESLLKTIYIGEKRLNEIGNNARIFVNETKNSKAQLNKVIKRIEESYEKDNK